MQLHKYIQDIVSVLLFVSVCVLWFFRKRLRLYLHAAKIPGPFAFPFFGSLHLFWKGRDTFLQVFDSLSKQYAPVAKLWIGPELVFIVTRPKDVELLTKTCLNKGLFYRWLEPRYGRGLFTSPAEKWKTHKKVVTRTLSQNILNSYMDIFIYHSKKMVGELGKKCQGVDAMHLYHTCAFEIMHDVSVGKDSIESKKRDRWVKWMKRGQHHISKRLFNPFYFFDFIWNRSNDSKEINKIMEGSTTHIKEIIDVKKKQLTRNEQDQPLPFLTRILLDVEDKWSREEYIDEVLVMFIAASETVSLVSSFLTVMLALHQNVQENLYQELFQIFGDSSRDVTIDDLGKMEYLERVIKETLRLFPVGPIVTRAVDKDVTLDSSYLIPEGSSILVPIFSIHRDPKWWKDPERFDPDRFLPEEVEKRPKSVFIPFSAPPRNCVGQKFGMMGLKIILSNLLRKFRVVSCQYRSMDDIRLHIDVLLEAADGYTIDFRPRYMDHNP